MKAIILKVTKYENQGNPFTAVTLAGHIEVKSKFSDEPEIRERAYVVKYKGYSFSLEEGTKVIITPTETVAIAPSEKYPTAKYEATITALDEDAVEEEVEQEAEV